MQGSIEFTNLGMANAFKSAASNVMSSNNKAVDIKVYEPIIDTINNKYTVKFTWKGNKM